MEPIVFTSVTQSPEECILGIQQICANGRNEGMNEWKVQEVRQVSVCTTWPQGLWSIVLMRRLRPRGGESSRQPHT